MSSDSFLNSLTFKYVSESDVERAFELESQGYPPEEAATLEKLIYRQKHAPELFLGAYLSTSSTLPHTSSSLQSSQLILIGFIVSTLTISPSLTEESMSHHDPSGKTVCIHSVCVDKHYRRRGVALALLKEYIKRLGKDFRELDRENEGKRKYERIVLISHDYLIPLYQKAGFVFKGESQIVHGNEKWFDLVLDLN
ncbi:18906_t:CDS:2 [Acaulospora morrowiae]|uniref:18906_t:CDS:1 n=1 Tax=Acaulospora morrowiae TaxID=94023 RepID=A0A9N9DRU0_9GLOM|nr:18906_t:CDS:2 [Acaulospora morrowiae]